MFFVQREERRKMNSLWPHFLQDENTGQWDYKDKARSAAVLYIKTKAVIGKHFVTFSFNVALFQYLMNGKVWCVGRLSVDIADNVYF